MAGCMLEAKAASAGRHVGVDEDFLHGLHHFLCEVLDRDSALGLLSVSACFVAPAVDELSAVEEVVASAQQSPSFAGGSQRHRAVASQHPRWRSAGRDGPSSWCYWRPSRVAGLAPQTTRW